MGGPNPERLASRPNPEWQRTLADFKKQGWALRAWCQSCGHDQAIDIDWMIESRGPGAIPWNRWVPCDRYYCPRGRAILKAAQPAAVGVYYRLVGRVPALERVVTMTMEQLDALVDGCANPGAIMLTGDDWISTMENPAAKPHLLPADGGGYYYRGIRVWIASDGPSRVLDAGTAEREGLG
ncbi:MAG: hypothetical protein WA840_10215 [Caulobacteraceae bacterium]